MITKPALGKGLGSLIPGAPSKKPSADSVLAVPVEMIIANPYQPRQLFEHQALEELIDSIREHGIMQPLVLTPAAAPGRYELIAGERRLRAAQILKHKTVPAIVRSASARQKLELALIENIQRRDLNPIERATAYQRLHDEFGLTQEQIAKQVGKPRSHVANSIRLLDLPEEIKKAIADERITEGHAKVIAGLDTSEAQLKYFKRVVIHNLTVRELETQVKQVKVKGFRRALPGQPTAVAALERKLEEALATKVKIKKKGAQGTIVIDFYSDDEFATLVRRLARQD